MDMADGTVARATKVFSKSAMGFDRTNHIIINTSLIIFLAQTSASFLAINFFLTMFYINYLFSRNYYIEKKQTIKFSMPKILLKNIIGLEGFIFIFCFGRIVFDFVEADILLYFYGASSLLMYTIKLRLFQSGLEE